MATWRQYDKLASRAAEVGAAAADFMSTLLDISPELDPLRARVMAATQDLNDELRAARRAAEAAVVRERGHRG